MNVECMQKLAGYPALKERAEKAEARVAELKSLIENGRAAHNEERVARDQLARRVAELEAFRATIVELAAYGHFERCHGEEPDDPTFIEALKTRVRVVLGSTDGDDLLEAAEMTTPSVGALTDEDIADLERPIAEVDAELRSMGIDPVALGKRGAAFVEKVKSEMVFSQDLPGAKPAPRVSVRFRLREVAKGKLDPDREAEALGGEIAALVEWAREAGPVRVPRPSDPLPDGGSK